MPIQAVEVGYRNRVSDGLQAAFGNDWWHDPPFLSLAGERRETDIEQTKRRLTSKGKPLITGQMVAGLSFGFWVAVMDRRYHPAIWSSHLRPAFPHLPQGVDHRRLHSEVGMVADLRNRLWHHEPIFRRNLMADYSRCMMVLGWLCPVKAKWIKPHCRVAQMMREKP